VFVRARTPSGAGRSVAATFTPPPTSSSPSRERQIDTVCVSAHHALSPGARCRRPCGWRRGSFPVADRAGSVTDSVVDDSAAARAHCGPWVGCPAPDFEAAVRGLTGSRHFRRRRSGGAPAQLLAFRVTCSCDLATALLTRLSQLKDWVATRSPERGDVTYRARESDGQHAAHQRRRRGDGGQLDLGRGRSKQADGDIARCGRRWCHATGYRGGLHDQQIRGRSPVAIVNTSCPCSSVRIVDQFGNSLSGTTVNAAVPSGAGSVVSAAQCRTVARERCAGASARLVGESITMRRLDLPKSDHVHRTARRRCVADQWRSQAMPVGSRGNA